MGAKGEKAREKIVNNIEIPYRQLDGLNYSMIKLYDKSPVEFYERFILNLPVEDEDSVATLIGNIVDDIVLEYHGNIEEFEQNFDSKYALAGGEPSTAQGFLLADELFKITVMSIVDGEITREFEDRFREAFFNIQAKDKYKGKTVEQGLEDFNKSNKAGYKPIEHFETKLANIGKKVVSAGIKAKALYIASSAFVDDFTKDLFNFEENETIEKLTKFPISFTYKDTEGIIEGKVEVDMMDIDHKNKTIQPYDVKTTYDNSQFMYNLLKNGYYIQAVWYTIAIVAWTEANGLKDYKMLPYKFIVFDTSSNNRRPVIKRLTEKHLDRGYEGFSYNGRSYKGVKKIVADIMWCDANGIWNTTKEVFENNGETLLEEFDL